MLAANSTFLGAGIAFVTAVVVVASLWSERMT